MTDRRGKFSLGQFYYNFARVWNVIITLVSRDENFKYERSFDSLSIRCKFLFAITNTSRKKHDKKVIFAQFSNLDENEDRKRIRKFNLRVVSFRSHRYDLKTI